MIEDRPYFVAPTFRRQVEIDAAIREMEALMGDATVFRPHLARAFQADPAIRYIEDLLPVARAALLWARGREAEDELGRDWQAFIDSLAGIGAGER